MFIVFIKMPSGEAMGGGESEAWVGEERWVPMATLRRQHVNRTSEEEAVNDPTPASPFGILTTNLSHS